VLFADLKGSMELLADRDPEEARRLLDPVLEKMIEAVHRYEGTVNQVMGDGIMALFGAPLALEDHAVRACYAALAMQASIRAYAESLRREHGVTARIRIGLNSGEVVVRAIGSDLHMDYTAVGQTTHLAARMEQLANPDTTLLTAATLQLAEGFVAVTPQGPVPVKGLGEPVDVYELTGTGAARSRLQAAALRGLTRFVGRTTEMVQMQRALEQAQSGRGQIVALVGEPGVGKSRLVWEFLHSHRMQGWLALESFSVSYGKASVYRPVIDLLKGYFQIEERDEPRRVREKVAGKLLMLDRQLEPLLSPLLYLLDTPHDDAQWEALDPSQKRLRLLDACKRLLLREAQVQPLVLVFEDLHWIDNETQSLLDSLVESLPGARVLLLVNYRPEYEHRWAAKSFYLQLRIDPLGSESAEDLLAALLGTDSSLTPVRPLLMQRTGGNPLFLEESVRSLIESGALTGARGQYRLTAAIGSIDVPATVQVIIAARIDRLAPEDKRLLQAAAVIGTQVSLPLIDAIADTPDTELHVALGRLQAAEFLYETSVFPTTEYEFKHALTHEVAYGSILAERKRELHRQVMETLESRHAEGIADDFEQLGLHALRAEAWEAAARYLHQGAWRAYNRSALRASLTLAEQAITAQEHLPHSPERLRTAIDAHHIAHMCWIGIGDFQRVYEHTSSSLRLAEELEDTARMISANGSMSVACFSLGDHAGARRHAERADALSRTSNDPACAALVGFWSGMAGTFAGRYMEARGLLLQCADTIRAALSAGHQQGPTDGTLLDRFLIWVQTYAAWSFAELGDFPRALKIARESVANAREHNVAYPLGYMLHTLGATHALKGDSDEAVPPLEEAVALAISADATTLLTQLGPRLGHAYKLAGRTAEAITVLEDAQQRGERTSNMAWLPLITAHLGDAYRLAGRLDDALAQTRHGLDLSVKHQARSYEVWSRYYLAEVLVARRDFDEAHESYRHAAQLAQELSMRPLLALSRLGLGELAILTGAQDARDHLATALAMTQEMGMQRWAAQAQAALARAPS
jgi:class 3 adenylate cyclase/tetratricopeptide (TPR) repeat protein